MDEANTANVFRDRLQKLYLIFCERQGLNVDRNKFQFLAAVAQSDEVAAGARISGEGIWKVLRGDRHTVEERTINALIGGLYNQGVFKGEAEREMWREELRVARTLAEFRRKIEEISPTSHILPAILLAGAEQRIRHAYAAEQDRREISLLSDARDIVLAPDFNELELTNPIQADEALLDHIAQLAFEGGRLVAQTARLSALSLIDKYRKSDTIGNEAELYLLARSHIVASISLNESHQIPPAAALEHLKTATLLANDLDDDELTAYVTWRKAAWWRKWGDVVQDPQSLQYQNAMTLLSAIVEDSRSSPLLKSAALQESAKVALGMRSDNDFTDFIQQAEDYVDVSTYHYEPDLLSTWPSFTRDQVEGLIRDTKIRGISTFGGMVNDVVSLASEARMFPDGLFNSFDKIVLPYAVAKAQMRSSASTDGDRVSALMMWLDALQYAEEHGHERQAFSGHRILAEIERDGRFTQWAPAFLELVCWRCRKTEGIIEPMIWTFNESTRRYMCHRCAKRLATGDS